MQPMDFTQFPNSAGWGVIHDADRQVYVLRNEAGRELAGTYTTRLFAERALYKYLEEVTTRNQELHGAKRSSSK